MENGLEQLGSDRCKGLDDVALRGEGTHYSL